MLVVDAAAVPSVASFSLVVGPSVGVVWQAAAQILVACLAAAAPLRSPAVVVPKLIKLVRLLPVLTLSGRVAVPYVRRPLKALLESDVLPDTPFDKSALPTVPTVVARPNEVAACRSPLLSAAVLAPRPSSCLVVAWLPPSRPQAIAVLTVPCLSGAETGPAAVQAAKLGPRPTAVKTSRPLASAIGKSAATKAIASAADLPSSQVFSFAVARLRPSLPRRLLLPSPPFSVLPRQAIPSLCLKGRQVVAAASAWRRETSLRLGACQTALLI